MAYTAFRKDRQDKCFNKHEQLYSFGPGLALSSYKRSLEKHSYMARSM